MAARTSPRLPRPRPRPPRPPRPPPGPQAGAEARNRARSRDRRRRDRSRDRSPGRRAAADGSRDCSRTCSRSWSRNSRRAARRCSCIAATGRLGRSRSRSQSRGRGLGARDGAVSGCEWGVHECVSFRSGNAEMRFRYVDDISETIAMQPLVQIYVERRSISVSSQRAHSASIAAARRPYSRAARP